MKFRTETETGEQTCKISHQTPVLMMGSCFTGHIGSILEKNLFPVQVNPFGVIYNPASVKRNLEALLDREQYGEADLGFHNGLWYSFDHYTPFSHPDKDKALEQINKAFRKAKNFLQKARFLVITFGTAWVYRFRETGQIVCNCHKIPARQFDRFLLDPATIVSDVEQVLDKIQHTNPGLHTLFTVSPVRHLKDGHTANQVSKSSLMLAVNQLVEGNPGMRSYFPSYEIMMDDLRDYRFYEPDMVHPNEAAITYIWEKFAGFAIDPASLQIINELTPLLKGRAHRPIRRDTPQYQKFISQLEEKERKLREKFPFLMWEALPEK